MYEGSSIPEAQLVPVIDRGRCTTRQTFHFIRISKPGDLSISFISESPCIKMASRGMKT